MKRRNKLPFAVFRFSRILMTSLLLITFTLLDAPSSNASIKPGSTCAKLNLKSSFANVPYICSKSGKKLIWTVDKKTQAAIKAAADAKAALEAKAAEDARIEADKKAAEDARHAAEAKAKADAESKKNAEIKAAAEKIAQENATFDIDHLYPRVVYEKSRAEIQKAISNGSVGEIKPTYHIGQNVDTELLKDAYIDMDDAIKLWSKYFQPKDLQIIFYDNTSKNWAGAKLEELSGYKVSNWVTDSCNANYCGNGAAMSNFNLPTVRYIFEAGIQREGMSPWLKTTVVHEYTHLAQTLFTNQNNQNMINWVLEGIAQFYGEAVSFAKFDTDKKIRSELHANYWFPAANSYFLKEFGSSDLPAILKQNKESNSVRIMERLEYKIPNRDEANLGYLFGGYAAEVLVSVYGHEKLVEFMQQFYGNDDFKSHFQKTYGMSTTDFYKKLTPYFAAMAEEIELKG